MKKLKFIDLKKDLKIKLIHGLYKLSSIYKITPLFHSEEGFVRIRVFCWSTISILLLYALDIPESIEPKMTAGLMTSSTPAIIRITHNTLAKKLP